MKVWEATQDVKVKPGSSASTSTIPHLSGREQLGRESMLDYEIQSGRSIASGQAEETTIYTETRMLQDQTGRLLYMGDASTLSILQLIRIIVENTAGAAVGSPFIDDPKRHRIMEAIIEFPDNVKVPCCLPDRQTTNILTCGLIEIFDKKAFIDSIDSCYSDPLSASNYLLCHLFLVLALGLVLAAPAPGSGEEAVIKRQHDAKMDRAELFFRSARAMCDTDTGFEDADFWSVQALSLMTLYMLAVSKRNTAYAYIGMAVRSGYALGLHREETMNEFIFNTDEMRVRRNLWKTLFILDRFLAASLGRPTAISEDDCSCKIILDNGDMSSLSTLDDMGFDAVHAKSLDACVRTCHIIGVTLRVFSQRKISTTVVQEIANLSKDWRHISSTSLHIQQEQQARVGPAQGIAALHVNLLSLHSLILLTRQLFIMHNWRIEEQRMRPTKKAYPFRESPMAKYSEACVVASYHTVRLVQSAREANYLPQRNPFIVLIVLMNQFASLYYTDAYEQTISDAIGIMRFCAETDAQAERLLEILEKFSQTVAKWTKDHTHEAPPLSTDLGGLYSQMTRSRLPRDHSSLASRGPGSQEQQDVARSSISHTLSPPILHPRPTLSELVISLPPISGADTRMNGVSPSQTTTSPLPHKNPARQSFSSRSIDEGSDSYNGDFEFSFDGLWNNWIAHGLPASSAPPPVTSPLTSQFPPMVPIAATEPFGAYPISPETRIPPLTMNIPLYHASSNFG
ncbi:fungal-specific transcription factor domain-containing protein [Bombardia bombarda]|uniref:Fungal-specific transcription factor domain-containing protein n=1 Tax=Bombardia bombarda TaxID=252184 RepID=A0AA39XAV1_9PEZI|nr:fungal-specific transcription factor domain-containing protein [Bombardia bombarda]